MRYRILIVPTHFCGEGTIYSHGFFYSVNFERWIYSSYKVVRVIIRKPAQCSIYTILKTKDCGLTIWSIFWQKLLQKFSKLSPFSEPLLSFFLFTLFKIAGLTRLETDNTIFVNFKEYFNNYAKSILYFCYWLFLSNYSSKQYSQQLRVPSGRTAKARLVSVK